MQWQQGHVKGAVAAGVAVLAGFAAIRWLRSRDRSGRGRRSPGSPGWPRWSRSARSAPAGGSSATTSSAATRTSSPQLRLADAAALGARPARRARSRSAASAASSTSTRSTAPTSRTEVQWLGAEGPDGAYERIPTCAEWRQALADGGYTHVVTTYDPFNPGTLTDTKEALWTREDPAAEQILRDGPVSVFELDGAPDPADAAATCPT